MKRNGILALAASLALACAHSEAFPVRGEIDRKNWLVHVCDSDTTYRVIFPSAVLDDFAGKLMEIGAFEDPAVPVVLAFHASPQPRMPWEERTTVGVRPPLSVARGRCDDGTGGP